uniref:HAT C-terminal dimerisation domain-containing protein n=1 Tax=Arundo donax TaxID=35708 RepID=A0A0A9H0W8_ARUDO
MRRFTKKRDIVRLGVTRFASAFLTLQSLYEKDQLRAMSQCDEWEKFCRLNHIKKNKKAVLATATMVKPAFWSGVALCLRVFEPLIKVLRMVDGDVKPSMAFLFGEILKAKKDINVGIGGCDRTGNLYDNVVEIIDSKMKDRLDSPLHLAAYFLNPYYSYNDPSIFTNEQVMDGFITAIETFYHGDYDKQSQVLNDELYKFKDQLGHFAKPVAKAGCKDFDFNPAKWWGNYGTQVPALQRMATRILSLTSSSSACERNWNCFEGIHTKKRNRLTCERLNQLVFVQYNNKMHSKREKAKKNKNMDPLLQTDASKAQGWMIEGGDEEDVDPVTGLTWKLTEEACGAEEVTKLCRSSRLSEGRDIDEEDFQSEAEEPINDEDIMFESDQEEVVPIMGYEGERENDD